MLSMPTQEEIRAIALANLNARDSGRPKVAPAWFIEE